MYHPIKTPDCEPYLKNLMDWARLAIAFSLSNDATTIEHDYDNNAQKPRQQNLVNELGQEFLDKYGGIAFLASVRNQFISQYERRDIGEWLWDKPVSVAAPVVRLLVIPHPAKKGVLQAFDNDLDIKQCFGLGSFQYKFISKAGNIVIEHIKSLMHNFYSDILAGGEGIPANLIGTTVKFNRQSVLQSYIRVNRFLNVCPGCDGQPPSISHSAVHEDIDHFFPKSKYPFLAIHPLNLTPYCKHCNETYKRDKDVMDAPGVASLTDIYHPYIRPAKDELQIVVQRSHTNGNPLIRLYPVANNSQNINRLNSLNYLLDIEARWQGDLTQDRLKRQVISALMHKTRGDAKELPLDNGWFYKNLSEIAEDMTYDIGQIPGSVPAKAYADWVANDEQEKNKWLGVYSIYRTIQNHSTDVSWYESWLSLEKQTLTKSEEQIAEGFLGPILDQEAAESNE